MLHAAGDTFWFLTFTCLKVVDEYNRREQEIKHLEKELEEKSNNLNAYRQKISEVCSRLHWSVEFAWSFTFFHRLCLSSRLRSVG